LHELVIMCVLINEIMDASRDNYVAVCVSKNVLWYCVLITCVFFGGRCMCAICRVLTGLVC
jgi:hypothetical protein